jgi:hypothetical protein
MSSLKRNSWTEYDKLYVDISCKKGVPYDVIGKLLNRSSESVRKSAERMACTSPRHSREQTHYAYYRKGDPLKKIHQKIEEEIQKFCYQNRKNLEDLKTKHQKKVYPPVLEFLNKPKIFQMPQPKEMGTLWIDDEDMVNFLLHRHIDVKAIVFMNQRYYLVNNKRLSPYQLFMLVNHYRLAEGDKAFYHVTMSQEL